jgi:fumarylacetoacetase
MPELNETHDPSLRSWVDSANTGADFSLQNLPFGVFRRMRSAEAFRGGVAIGDYIVDLAAAAPMLTGLAAQAALAAGPQLNQLMAMGSAACSALRLSLSRALRAGSPSRPSLEACLVPRAAVEYALPSRVGDYTDFYSSIHHATAVGKLFRPDRPLLPNFKWLPIGYHGRSSSLGVSGQAFARPVGQILPAGSEQPVLAPTRRLDYELELGVFIGSGNELGTRIAIDAADSHIFGLCLLNDWSARDVQAWEYQPLGPFLGKNFASTVSPWIVTLEALAPYRLPWTRVEQDPQPLPYLDSQRVRAQGAIDICLEVALRTERMRAQNIAAVSLATTNFRHSYWTIEQMITHHSVGGCNLQPGDLLGSGTQSGPNASEAGSLLELSQGGSHPIALGNGETRTFLEDGDTVVMRGWCERPGAARVGFGEVIGHVLPAR